MHDVVIVGDGIAGSAMAMVLVRRRFKVAVLERQAGFRDRLRGEFMQPWGVAEAMQLDLGDVFEDAGGIF